MSNDKPLALSQRDALIIVDMQLDFLPGGALGVAQGDQIIPLINHYIERFTAQHATVVATRDWHPENHCSFKAQGGIWPPHCIQHTEGARLTPDLQLPDTLVLISKAASAERDAYSGFDGTRLTEHLRQLGIERVFVCGLATDYCVLNTVLDALKAGFTTFLLQEAMRAVEMSPGDGEAAISQMLTKGAHPIGTEEIM